MEYISKLFLNDNNLLLHNETINEMYELTQENISNYASFSPTFFFFLIQCMFRGYLIKT